VQHLLALWPGLVAIAGSRNPFRILTTIKALRSRTPFGSEHDAGGIQLQRCLVDTIAEVTNKMYRILAELMILLFFISMTKASKL
jgi:hypothetical protein